MFVQHVILVICRRIKLDPGVILKGGFHAVGNVQCSSIEEEHVELCNAKVKTGRCTNSYHTKKTKSNWKLTSGKFVTRGVVNETDKQTCPTKTLKSLTFIINIHPFTGHFPGESSRKCISILYSRCKHPCQGRERSHR